MNEKRIEQTCDEVCGDEAKAAYDMLHQHVTGAIQAAIDATVERCCEIVDSKGQWTIPGPMPDELRQHLLANPEHVLRMALNMMKQNILVAIREAFKKKG